MPAMIDIEELTVAQAQDAFRQSRFTSRDLCEAYLARIDKFDKAGPKINATMALSTTALDEASALDAYFKDTGEFKGPLHGVPILIKDQVMNALTAYSNRAWRARPR